MKDWLKECRGIIVDYYYDNDIADIAMKDVFVVWSCKTLQNKKALLSTTNNGDGMYFECTYNGDKDETYFDVYLFFVNIEVSLIFISVVGTFKVHSISIVCST